MMTTWNCDECAKWEKCYTREGGCSNFKERTYNDMNTYEYTKGMQIIKKYEGLRLTAYKCPAGVWTIGWGHTKGVKEGDTITLQTAERLLADDVASITESATFRAFCETYNMSNNQANALLSFVFNGGIGWLNQVSNNYKRDRDTIGEKLLLYVNAGGKRLEGLVRRREEEHALYVTPDEPRGVQKRPPITRIVVTAYDEDGNVIETIEI